MNKNDVSSENKYKKGMRIYTRNVWLRGYSYISPQITGPTKRRQVIDHLEDRRYQYFRFRLAQKRVLCIDLWTHHKQFVVNVSYGRHVEASQVDYECLAEERPAHPDHHK